MILTIRPNRQNKRESNYVTANEALHLSEKEEKTIFDIIANIEQEIDFNIDSFTQDLLVSNLDLLLKYCDRYYNRRFLTRKIINSDLLSRLELLLDDYFNNDKLTIRTSAILSPSFQKPNITFSTGIQVIIKLIRSL